MKLLEIALFLFNIFGFAISTDELIPQNVEIVLRQYTDPLTGKRQEKTYEKRSNYLEEGDRFLEKEFQDLSDLNALQGIRDELKKAADDIVRPYNNRLKPGRHQDELKADDTARFSVTFTGLDVGAVHKLLAGEPNPKRVSGKVKIGYNFEDRISQLDAQLAALHDTGVAAAAAAKGPPRDSAASQSVPLSNQEHTSLQAVAQTSSSSTTVATQEGTHHTADGSESQQSRRVRTEYSVGSSVHSHLSTTMSQAMRHGALSDAMPQFRGTGPPRRGRAGRPANPPPPPGGKTVSS